MADEKNLKEFIDETTEEENEENEEVVEDENEEIVDDEEIEGIEEGIVPGMSERDLAEEVKNSFLDYAMSVIVSRALPDVRDGLKPVHRRIIFGMNALGMQPDKPYRKSARIVGDVMGKYHPHGDSAIYGSLVRLAQPFSIRYTLVDGHGNFGSIDGDGAAAMRYTEARMSKIAMELVRDINKDTVDFMDNYDGEEQEPVVLPSRFPNLLVNGSSGIAVGMATNIPPHNLVEVINAVQAIAKNPDLTPLEIMSSYLYGPDFPTGGIILGRSGIRKAYETGQGSIVLRSRTEIQEMANGKKRIIISEIPYQVNKSLLVDSIAKLVHNKIIEGITDIRDESNKQGIRIVIELRKDVIAEVILNQLFKNTQLQVSFGIIMLALVNGEPLILPIDEMLKKYLEHQCEVIERRTRYDLNKALDRLHILEGLLTAIDSIDAVIEIIRGSKTADLAKSRLIETFSLSEVQAKAILEMRLGRLVGLEKDKIVDEISLLKNEVEKFRYILSSHEHVVNIVVEELEEIKQKYGDERKTEINNNLIDIEDEDLIPEEDVVITLTTNGYIKRLVSDTFKVQNRGGRGIKGMQTNEDDVVDKIVYAKTHTDLLFFTNSGKVYRLRGHQVPEYSRTSKGLPVVNLLSLEKDEKVMSIVSVDNYEDGQYLFFATKQGVVKRVSLLEFASIRQNGKKAIVMRENDELLSVKLTNGQCLVSISASNGKMVTFKETDVRVMGRSAAGVRGMDVQDSEAVGLTISNEGKYILSITEHGYGKMSPLEEYRLTSRGTKGVITINMTEKTGKLITTKAVNGDEDVVVITKEGIVIRTQLKQVSIVGRNTQGVKIIRVDEKDSVSSLAILKAEDNEIAETESEESEVQNNEND